MRVLKFIRWAVAASEVATTVVLVIWSRRSAGASRDALEYLVLWFWAVAAIVIPLVLLSDFVIELSVLLVRRKRANEARPRLAAVYSACTAAGLAVLSWLCGYLAVWFRG